MMPGNYKCSKNLRKIVAKNKQNIEVSKKRLKERKK